MIADHEREAIFEILDSDRRWSAYALADLDPTEKQRKTWPVARRSVLLIYYGLDPPVIFAQGEPEEVLNLSQDIPAGRYYYTLMATHRALLGNIVKPEFQLKMWRMWHNPEERMPSLEEDPDWPHPEGVAHKTTVFVSSIPFPSTARTP